MPVHGLEGMGADDLDDLKGDLKKIEGQTQLVPALGSRAGDSASRSGDVSWKSQRLGISPSEALVDLRAASAVSVLAAAGIPPSMYADGGDASSAREGYRLFAFSTLAPVADLVALAFSEYLEVDVQLGIDRTFAADVQSRSRAFKSLRDAGVSLQDAAAATGIRVTGTSTEAPPTTPAAESLDAVGVDGP